MAERAPLLREASIQKPVLSRYSTVTSVGDDAVFISTPWRWWALFWYAYLSALQSLIWLTWSSVPDSSKEYLNVGDNTLDLFLNEGPIAYVCVIFFATWLLTTRNGLSSSVKLAAIMCFLAAILRCLPIVLSSDQLVRQHNLVIVVIHVAQIINAAAAPMVIASPSYLSLLWFPDRQRNLATAVANVASALGRAIGFYLGPAVVQKASDLDWLLGLEAVLALLPVLAVFAYYPNEPEQPPSKGALDEKQYRQINSGSSMSLQQSFRHTLSDLSKACGNINLLVIALAGGLEMGVYGAWSGVLPNVLSSRFSDTMAGAFGAVNTFAGIVGGLLIGWSTDSKLLAPRLKTVAVLLSLSAAAVFFILALAFSPYRWQPFASWSTTALLTMCGLAGFLRGSVDPLYFEMAADAIHPGPAGVAGSVLTFLYHALAVASLSVPADQLNMWAMTLMYAAIALTGVMLIPVRMQYFARRNLNK
eukprot:TRINITY_DN17455_c0_g1_i1.p1 TRINITY_DN17455_c0_g1~~TRINITY_DN17455_c0_g1_i1.p1  ORF type:complete len:475 (+),score=68.02 TRINITY_DN17455_c0_g1_i1:49-1473(+)